MGNLFKGLNNRAASIVLIIVVMIAITGCAKTPDQLIDEAKSVYRADPDKGIDLYKKVKELEPYNTKAWFGIAKIYDKEEDYDKLDDILEEIYVNIDAFEDEEEVLDKIKDYIEEIEENDPEELGRWAEFEMDMTMESKVVESKTRKAVEVKETEVKATEAKTTEAKEAAEEVKDVKETKNEDSVDKVLVEKKVEVFPDFIVNRDKTSASSELYENYSGGTIYNYASNVHDADSTTAWVEDLPGTGIGEWISFESDQEGYVRSISLINGYSKTSKLYYLNDRLAKFRLEFSDGSYRDYEVNDDDLTMQTIVFDQAILTKSVKLIIKDVYSGSDYADCCITEVYFNKE